MDSDDKADSSNLRDFLRRKEDDNNYYGGRSQTLGRALSDGKRGGAGPPERIQSIRTLLDVIRDDPPPGGNAKDGKKSWKYIKDKLRLRRQGSGSSWISSVPVPASDVPINQNNSRSMSRRDSIRMNMPVSDGSSNMVVEMSPGSGLPRTRSAMFQRNASRAVGRESLRYDSYTCNNNNNNNEPEEADEEAEGAAGDSTEEEAAGEAEAEDGGGESGGGGGGEQQPAVRMSLMALLAETDRQMGIDGLAAFTMADDDDEEEEEEEKGGGGEYSACCVCMVRHKGAAFIPCGHTFCRLCSRELWVQRGNCPLCNNFILEILDIF